VSTFHPVTPSFLATLAACSSDGRGALILGGTSPPLTLYPKVGEDGVWACGTSAAGWLTMTEELRAVLAGSTATSDGGFVTAAGDKRGLYDSGTGACESGPPPPPPPP
jgi:hypothetical protein